MCSKKEPSVFDNMSMCGGCGGGIWPDDKQELDSFGNLAHFDCMQLSEDQSSHDKEMYAIIDADL